MWKIEDMRFLQSALLILFASSYAKAAWEINLPSGVTLVSHDIYHLHMTIFWICVAIAMIVFGVMFYSIIHHRKSKGAKAASFHEHLWLELTWTFIPFVILILMAVPATKVLIHMRDTSKADITIKITGYQWKWRYEYIDQGISFFSNLATPFTQIHNQAPKDANYLHTVDHPLVVPIHQKIRFLVTSNDVIHSWWVIDFGLKQDAVPGYINEAWTRIDKPGTYYGQCAELCGVNHSYMPIVVIAVPKKDFDAWVMQQKGIAPPPVTQPQLSTPPTISTKPATSTTTVAGKKYTLADLMSHGEQIYLNTCAVCHQPSGEGMPPTFPALKGDKTTKGPVNTHISTVLNGRPGTSMQAFKDQLNDDDLAAVITYERNAFGNNTGDAVQPEQVKALRGK
jgi:cytochrome c oxidase subunit 2